MQRKQAFDDAEVFRDAASAAGHLSSAVAQRGCYGVQVLVAGRHKRWRDEISAEIRRAGFCATTVDSAVDALTVLVLGIPVDVLVTNADLCGSLGCSRLAAEARALRPNLGIVLACDSTPTDCPDLIPSDAILMPRHGDEASLATTVRVALATRI